VWAIRMAAPMGGGASGTEVAGEVAREVVERPARGRHVDEAEQRRAQLRVLRGQLHRLRVEGTDRVARARREARRQLTADLVQIALDGGAARHV